jgi:hypothetical protein
MAGTSTISNVFGGAASRFYARHMRHGVFARLRHSRQARNFLTEQGERLDSPADTAASVYEKLRHYTAERVKEATHASDLP